MHICAFLFPLLMASSVAAPTPTLDPAQLMVARIYLDMGSRGAPLSLDFVEEYMMQQRQLIAEHPVEKKSNQPLSQARAGIVEELLKRDIDNDGKITAADLRIFLAPQAKTTLYTNTGVSLEPTKEQSEQIMKTLIAKELLYDTDGDGAVDFDEMRMAAFNKTASLDDPLLLKKFGTPANGVMSREDLLTVIRSSFNIIDADKNGIISRQEAQPFLPPYNL